jgi:hypothetical protein
MNKYLILLIVLIISVFAGHSELVLQGQIPSGIKKDLLEKEYSRIRKCIQPNWISDTSDISIIYYTQRDQRKLGVRLPEWGGGGAIGNDTIIVPVDKAYAFFSGDYFRITLHELVHIAINRAYGYIRVPRWFHEGMAMQLSGDINFDESIMLSRAIITKQLMSFDSIEIVNRFTSVQAQIAYSQSHYALQYMTRLYGYEILPELLDSAKNIRSFDSACVKVFGLTTKEFERIVTNDLIKRYKLIFIFSDFSLLWVGIFVLAILAFVMTQRRNQKRLQKMEKEESEENDNEDEYAGTDWNTGEIHVDNGNIENNISDSNNGSSENLDCGTDRKNDIDNNDEKSEK